jgi:O-antigen ligase
MPFGFLRPEGGDFIWRAGGTLVSSIHLAGYLEAVAPFAVGLAVFGVRSWVPRVFAVAVALLSYSGVLLTGSRGGYISSIFSILVMAALALWLGLRTGMLRRRVLLPVGVAVLLAVMGAAAVALVGQPRMRERLFRSDTTENIRFANWKAAIRQWQKSPWIGTGARTHLYYGRLYREPVLQSDPEHAHNDYLETLAEYGVVGLALLLGVVALHAVSGMQGLGCLAATMREDPYEGPRLELALLFGAIGALAAYIAHSVTDFNLHLPSHALLFAVIFGFLASGGRVEETVPPGRQPRWVIRARWVVPLLAVWLAFLVGPMVPAEYYAEKQRAAVRDVGRGERQLERSIWYGETALRWKPNHPQVYYYLGQANRLLAAQKPYTANRPWLEKAEQAYRKGLEQFPQDFDLWLRLGQTLDAQRRFADAGKAYEEAIRRDPKLAIGHHYHAYHLEKAGYEKKAKEAFERARAFYSGDLDALTNAALHREED